MNKGVKKEKKKRGGKEEETCSSALRAGGMKPKGRGRGFVDQVVF